MEKNMRTNFNRVRLKCEALLAQNVDELKKEVKGLRVELKDVREALEGKTIRPPRKTQLTSVQECGNETMAS
jgi:hypothetical protein